MKTKTYRIVALWINEENYKNRLFVENSDSRLGERSFFLRFSYYLYAKGIASWNSIFKWGWGRWWNNDHTATTSFTSKPYFVKCWRDSSWKWRNNNWRGKFQNIKKTENQREIYQNQNQSMGKSSKVQRVSIWRQKFLEKGIKRTSKCCVITCPFKLIFLAKNAKKSEFYFYWWNWISFGWIYTYSHWP